MFILFMKNWSLQSYSIFLHPFSSKENMSLHSLNLTILSFRIDVIISYISCLNFEDKTLRIYIIKGFRTIVFIFIVISTTFRLICPPAFFKCLSNSGTFMELRTTSFIESTGVACSDILWESIWLVGSFLHLLFPLFLVLGMLLLRTNQVSGG